MLKVILVLLLIYLWFSSSRSTVESFKKSLSYYTSCKQPSFTKVEQSVVDSMGIKRSNSEADWDIFVPCNYTMAASELKFNNGFKYRKDGWVMMIAGMDSLAAKDQLATLLHKKYGKIRSLIYAPRTWVLSNEEDVKDLQKYATQHEGTGKQYILKKNVQRQEGLKIVNSWSEGYQEFQKSVEKPSDYPYVVCQEVLKNPYIIGGRKTNIRCYILFICEGDSVTAYLHTNGFVYYSKAPYVNGTTPDEIITSGYIDREVYENNPLTLKDLWVYLDKKHGPGSANNYKSNLLYVLTGVLDAYKDNLCEPTENKVKYCQMFGADVEADITLTKLRLLEMNKSPSMTIMDDRDHQVKTKVMSDAYKMMGIDEDPHKTNEFVKIWSTKRS